MAAGVRTPVRSYVNPHLSSGGIQPLDSAAATRFHRQLPGYAPSPLTSAPTLADELGVAEVLLKFEHDRWGLPAFKILGASWASRRLLTLRLGLPGEASQAEIRERLRQTPVALVCATDGNHGRAVARSARWLGVPATVYVPNGTAAARVAAIEDEGGKVVVVDGTYDDAVAASAAAARADDTLLLVADTTADADEIGPSLVVEGYGTLYSEVLDARDRSGDASPDFVVVGMGVGSLASAAVRYSEARGRPWRVIGVEPADADCVYRSLVAGRPAEVPGPHRSVMAGLNCGQVSMAAWQSLRVGLAAAVAIGDELVGPALRRLHDLSIPAGETGAAPLAGLLAVRMAGRLAEVGLNRLSRVLLVVSEGVTDPETTRVALAASADCESSPGVRAMQ